MRLTGMKRATGFPSQRGERQCLSMTERICASRALAQRRGVSRVVGAHCRFFMRFRRRDYPFTRYAGALQVVASELQPALLSHQDAAGYLSVSERKLSYLVDDGKIEPVRIDRCVRYRLTDLNRFVDSLPTKCEGKQ